MTFQLGQSLEKTLEKKKITKHPFYQMWSCGKLEINTIREYSKQYHKLVEASPRYMGYVYGACSDQESRRKILWNLVDEEGKRPHSEMWLDFCEALGLKRNEVLNEQPIAETRKFLSSMEKLASRNFLEGSAALYAYEGQSPEVAKTKMDGLKKFYNTKEGLEFFRVHSKLDKLHAKTWLDILERHASPKDSKKCVQAANECLEGLWQFLDGITMNFAR